MIDLTLTRELVTEYSCHVTYKDTQTELTDTLIEETQLYQYFGVFFFYSHYIVSDEPEVFLPKYSQTAILHAAHFQRVVNICFCLVSYNTHHINISLPFRRPRH